jgi:septum formation protein
VSPQRRAILAQLGVAFQVRPAGVDELTSGDPEAVALENARRKADAIAARLGPGEQSRVLGVDTVVALDGELYGKPADEDGAITTLTRLSGRTHRVISGLVLRPGGERIAVTHVTFRALTADQIRSYAVTGEWRGRAGGYAIQERGAWLVARIDGDYTNVVGLPAGALLDLAPDLL